MGDLWQDATFGPLGAVIALVLLAYYMAGEPLLGRWAADRLRRSRSSDPGALLSFYQLTVACLAAAAAVVMVVVAVEPGLTAHEIGLAWPDLPAGVARGVTIGVLVGAAAGIGVGVLLAGRGATPAVAPETMTFLLPVSPRERRWAAAVAVAAGTAEELVFRGLFLALGIGLLGLTAVLAAFLVTLVFAFAHLYQGAQGILMTFVLGGMLAVIVLQTESLLPAMLLHVAIDLRSLLLTRAPA